MPIARVVWRTAEHGGRHAPPVGPRYSTPARFDAAEEDWSVVLDLLSRPEGSGDWIAGVRFMSDEAPQHLLTEGAHFELYEGKKCVGEGTVLPAASPPGRPTDGQLAVNNAKVT